MTARPARTWTLHEDRNNASAIHAARIAEQRRKRAVVWQWPDLVARYRAGATIRDLAAEYRISKSQVRRILAGRVQMRPRGKPARPIIDPERDYDPEPLPVVVAPSLGPRTWCGQCERRPTIAEAQACRAAFCKGRG